jgi:hypothetical protein
MKALEFRSKIRNNQILIPHRLQSELATDQDRDVRVIILIDDPEMNDYSLEMKAAESHFLEGFAESDSIYDTD